MKLEHAGAPDKTRLREKAKKRRSAAAAASTSQSLAAATDTAYAAIAERAFAADVPLVVGVYHAIGDEAPTTDLVRRLATDGAPIALPRVPAPGATPQFKAWTLGEELEPDACRVPGPAATARTVRPGVIVAPLLAFDRRGGRLGYGGGYFDRAIAEARSAGDVFVLGFAFADQETARVPMEGHDAVLDAVATERGLILFDAP